MSATKINLVPVGENQVKLNLSLIEIEKDTLEDLGNSYLLKASKRSKSLNELSFSIFFNKRIINKPNRNGGNPIIQVSRKQKLLTLDITLIINEEDIQEADGFYIIKKEYASEPAFELMYKMNSSYYSKKILEVKNGTD